MKVFIEIPETIINLLECTLFVNTGSEEEAQRVENIRDVDTMELKLNKVDKWTRRRLLVFLCSLCLEEHLAEKPLKNNG